MTIMMTAKELHKREWWKRSSQDVCRILKTDSSKGLSSEEAAKRLMEGRVNQLPEEKKASLFKLFLIQFSSFIVWVLIFAAFIALSLGEWGDASAISIIIILNASLGFFQEYRAEKSLAALRKMITPSAKVIRDGLLRTVPASTLVPGDIILIEAGDQIPADGRFVSGSHVATQEASLTGESALVSKCTDSLEASDLALGDKQNMGFMGTVVLTGKGFMVVTETGLDTELGKIASLLQKKKEESTPLEIRLEELGRRLVLLCLGIVVVVFGLGFLQGQNFIDNLMISLSLAVAAIPEGLPAVVTITLSVGVHRMAKRYALMRRLASVETLGCTTVICTDKTGTLTQNEMTVRSMWIEDRVIDLTGVGYIPEGSFVVEGAPIDPCLLPDLVNMLTIASLCSSAELSFDSANNTWSVIGDPTEGALLTAARKAGLIKRTLEEQIPLVAEIPFDPDRKRMSMIRKTTQGMRLFCKGAPDVILDRSTYFCRDGKIVLLSPEDRSRILSLNQLFGLKALRVLAVAYRPLPENVNVEKSLEEELVFVGLVAMMDPPRKEAVQSLEMCRRAGIKTVMITGDHKETALAIARELGMVDERSSAITGAELDNMDDQQFMSQVRNITVYARTTAEHKLRIVRAWKSLGDIVAMTGDGVNDAPAIKEADIGVAMGKTGTDVTREASDMVILDDNFASIVNAVESGRGIYDNIIKFVSYLMSSNIAELLVVFVGLLLSLKDPAGGTFVALTAVQILWLNFVTDGFPAIALGLDPVDPSAMDRPPRKPSDPIISAKAATQLSLTGLAIALGALAACSFGLRVSAALAHTMTFTTLVVLELVRVQTVRAQYNMSLFSNPLLLFALLSSFLLQLVVVYTPYLQPIFGTTPLSWIDWAVLGGIAIIVGGISKAINRAF